MPVPILKVYRTRSFRRRLARAAANATISITRNAPCADTIITQKDKVDFFNYKTPENRAFLHKENFVWTSKIADVLCAIYHVIKRKGTLSSAFRTVEKVILASLSREVAFVKL